MLTKLFINWGFRPVCGFEYFEKCIEMYLLDYFIFALVGTIQAVQVFHVLGLELNWPIKMTVLNPIIVLSHVNQLESIGEASYLQTLGRHGSISIVSIDLSVESLGIVVVASKVAIKV